MSLLGKIYRQNDTDQLYIITLVDSTSALNKFSRLYLTRNIEHTGVNEICPLIVLRNLCNDKDTWITQYNSTFLESFTHTQKEKIVARLNSIDLTRSEYTVLTSLLQLLDDRDVENRMFWTKIIPAIEEIKE